MTDRLEAVDLSVYQGSVSQDIWQRIKARGVELAIVGAAHPRVNLHAEGNLLRASSAGLRIATYLALAPGVAGRSTVATAKQACGRMWEELAFCAVDCEVNGLTAAQINEAVEHVRLAGQRPIIYTAHWWWAGHFGNVQTFRDLPLWNAYYDGDPDFDFARQPYGGWTLESVVGEQYTGSIAFEGTTVDRNSFRRDFIETGELTMSQYEELKKLIEDNKAADEQRNRDLLAFISAGLINLQGQITNLPDHAPGDAATEDKQNADIAALKVLAEKIKNL